MIGTVEVLSELECPLIFHFLFAMAVSSPWMTTKNIGFLSNTKDSPIYVTGVAGSRTSIRTARSGLKAKALFNPKISSLGHG